MKRPRQMREHRLYPTFVDDAPREWPKLPAHAIIFLREARRGRTGYAFGAKMRFVMLDDVVKLPERTLLLDLTSGARDVDC